MSGFFRAENIAAGYGKTEILHGVSLELPAGRVCGLLGANGCGKTTLLKSICGISPHAGSCVLQNEMLEGLPPKKLAQKCAYIPQQSGISIALSVREVVLMAFNPQLKLLQNPTGAMKKAADRALAEVGMADYAERDFQTLSAGQKQLCLLARAMAGTASLLILDEPESALDLAHRGRAMALLRRWALQGQRGVLCSLHDPQLALNGCGWLVLMKSGRVLAQIDPKTEPLPRLEALLQELYGPLRLVQLEGQRVLLWEDTLC